MDPLTIGLIVAGIGALGGLLSGIDDSNRKRKAAQAQKDYLAEDYRLQEENLDKDFAEAQKQANRNADKANLQADLIDQAQDIAETTLSNDINTAIDNLYLSGASDTYEWNQQAMAAGQSEGASYAQLASSGVRAGSSLSDAVEMQSATNSALLQFSQDAKRRSDNNNLGNVLNQLAGNEFNIMENRIGADQTRQDALDLVNSYLEGGYNYNIYQNQKDRLKNTRNYNLNQLQTEIADNTFWKGGNGNAWLKLGTGILTGGASGFSTGYDIANTINDAGGYNPNKKTKGGKASTGTAAS